MSELAFVDWKLKPTSLVGYYIRGTRAHNLREQFDKNACGKQTVASMQTLRVPSSAKRIQA